MGAVYEDEDGDGEGDDSGPVAGIGSGYLRQTLLVIGYVACTRWAVRYQPFSQNVLLLVGLQLCAVAVMSYMMKKKLPLQPESVTTSTRVGLGILFAVEMVLTGYSIARNPIWRYFMVVTVLDVVMPLVGGGGDVALLVPIGIVIAGVGVSVVRSMHTVPIGLLLACGVVCVREARMLYTRRMAQMYTTTNFALHLNQSSVPLVFVFVLGLICSTRSVANHVISHAAGFLSTLCVVALVSREWVDLRLFEGTFVFCAQFLNAIGVKLAESAILIYLFSLVDLAWTCRYIALGLSLYGLGTAAYFLALDQRSDERVRLYTFKLAAIVTIYLFTFAMFQSGSLLKRTIHPITELTQAAHLKHSHMVRSQSTTFVEAVQVYRERYGRHPPPGFYEWYQFARRHNVLIVDDFDTIFNDIEPFWGMQPGDIRHRLDQLFQFPNSRLRKIRIRNGVLELLDTGFNDNERMLFKFVEHLPDMNLLINQLPDEPMLAVPYSTIQAYLDEAKKTRNYLRYKGMSNSWPSVQLESLDLNNTEVKKIEWWECKERSPMVKLSHCCPDNLLPGPELSGQFVGDFDDHLDYCAHPELQRMHGMLMHPNICYLNDLLLPIFSSCKLKYMSDITIPSGYYYGKSRKPIMKETMQYSDKHAKVFWRGATTGTWHVAAFPEWNKTQRHRFVELTNNRHNPHPTIDVLVQDPIVPGYALKPFDTAGLNDEFFDVGITKITNCEPEVCKFIEQHQGKAASVSESDMFAYKYLADLDGNSFSQRIYTFFQSGSVPIKATMFTEWFNERVVPWVHYIPLSNSYLDIYSILFYYSGSGYFKPLDGDDGIVLPHEKEARAIAEQGQEWIEQTMRAEDMEVYYYRLLLEYARVIRDERDSLGYSGDGSEYPEP